LEYLDSLKEKLLQELGSTDIITATTAKILLYNVFDEKVGNNNTIATIHPHPKPIKQLINNGIQTTITPHGDDYLIMNILIKLYRPVLFICVFALLKVKFYIILYNKFFLDYIFFN
jgi:hypothetical protein